MADDDAKFTLIIQFFLGIGVYADLIKWSSKGVARFGENDRVFRYSELSSALALTRRLEAMVIYLRFRGMFAIVQANALDDWGRLEWTK